MGTIIERIKRAGNYLVHNRNRFCESILRNYFTWLPDKMYLKLCYRFKLGRKLNL